PVADGRPADAAGGPAAAGRGAAGTSAEAEGSVTIQQDAAMLATILGGGGKRPYTFAAGRKGLLFVASGAAVAGGERLERGDSLFVAGSGTLPVEAEGAVHLVLFDVPAVAP
ncbi:MAG TPA: hypothetical protein VNU01_04235, partial [Egibacteraceae bacterium]|nr:hypothetical protein [Egibacteraceae bacterium]